MKFLLAACLFCLFLTSCDKKDPEPISKTVQFKTTAITGSWNCDSLIYIFYDADHAALFTKRTKFYNNSQLLKFINDDKIEDGRMSNSDYKVNATGTYTLNDKTLTINIHKTQLLYPANYYINQVTQYSLVFSDTVFNSDGSYELTLIKAWK